MTGIPTHIKKRTELGLAVLLGAALVVLVFASQASPVQAHQSPQPAAASAGQAANEDCLTCHSQVGMTMTLQPSGEVYPLTVDPAAFAKSVHGAGGIACTACHTNITGYPHPEFTPGSLRVAKIQMSGVCQNCHADQAQKVAAGVHQAALDAGDKNAAVCSDCHNPHTQLRMTDQATGTLIPTERIKIPTTCARCHNAIFEEYTVSAHGKLLLSTGNIDVPSCTECHGTHDMANPTTAEFRLASTDLCASCHTDPVKMAKYGLSTQVMSTYVSDFHGTTVSIFKKSNPSANTNKPVCFDCHGVHSIAKVDDPDRGLKIKDNLLAACKRCHPDATNNFPDSWMSHYIATPRHNGLVYYVQLFYFILIPAALGIMAFIILTDVYRKMRERGKGAKH